MHLTHIPSTQSTMDDVRALAAGGAPAATVVRADEQRAGRGRSLPWASPKGGLWFSVLLRPSAPPAQWPLLSLAAGCAVAAALEARGHVAMVKWPNDVLTSPEAGGLRKVAGILLEARSPEWAIVGVGVNAGFSESKLPHDLAEVATTLPMRREEVDALFDDVVDGILLRATRVDQGEGDLVREEWRRRSATLGRQVEVGDVKGRAVDVAEDGALVVETEGGRVTVRAPAP